MSTELSTTEFEAQRKSYQDKIDELRDAKTRLEATKESVQRDMHKIVEECKKVGIEATKEALDAEYKKCKESNEVIRQQLEGLLK